MRLYTLPSCPWQMNISRMVKLTSLLAGFSLKRWKWQDAAFVARITYCLSLLHRTLINKCGMELQELGVDIEDCSCVGLLLMSKSR